LHPTVGWCYAVACWRRLRGVAPPPSDALTALLRAVGAAVATHRRQHGLTQEQLAARLGIATKNLQRIERGRQNLTLGSLLTLAQTLEVDPASLLPGRETVVAHDDLTAVFAAQGWRFLPNATGVSDAVPVWQMDARGGKSASARVPRALGAVVVPPALRRRAGSGGFVTQIAGASMAPRVPAGAWCLLRAPVEGPLEGRTLLFELRDATDPDEAGAYSLKKFAGIAASPGAQPAVRLESLQPDRAPLLVALDVFASLRVVGELVAVLVPREEGLLRAAS
jgi:transcriptional regulator with XRE-family HTH domain